MKTIEEVEQKAADEALEKHLEETPAFEPEPAPTGPPVEDAGDVEASEANPPMWRVEQIRKLWASGFVTRWHCNSDHRLRMSGDMNGGHCHRVAILYMGLFMHQRNNAEMLAAHSINLITALLHDAPEVISGDIPQPGKLAVPPLKDGDKATEQFYWGAVVGSGVNWSHKAPELTLCDLLDAILFVKQRAPDLLDHSWRKDMDVCFDMARELGVFHEVEQLILGEWVY